jgi:hypothetical protein
LGILFLQMASLIPTTSDGSLTSTDPSPSAPLPSSSSLEGSPTTEVVTAIAPGASPNAKPIEVETMDPKTLAQVRANAAEIKQNQSAIQLASRLLMVSIPSSIPMLALSFC